MPKLNFDTKDIQKSSVEIVIQIRDKNGNPTGKTKSFDGNHKDAGDWYSKQSRTKKKRRRKKKEDKK